MLLETTREYVLLASIINCCFWLVAVVLAFAIYRLPLYHPMAVYLLYHFVGFVYRPFLIWSNGYSHLWRITGIVPKPDDLAYGIIAINAALIATMVGFLWAKGPSGRIQTFAPFNLDITKPVAFACTTLLVSALGLYSVFKNFGGTGLKQVMAYKAHMDKSGSQQLVGISGYQTIFQEFFPAVILILYASSRTRTLSYLALVTYVAVRLYCGAERSSFVVIIAAVIFMNLVLTKRRYPTLTVIAVAFAVAFLFDVVGGDRLAFRKIIYNGIDTASATYSNYEKTRGQNGLSSDVVEYDVASDVFTLVPSRTGWSYGTQYLRLFVWPIPRQLWPDKPVITNTIDLNIYGNFYGCTHTLYGDAYMVLGLPSMILLLGIIGAYLTKLYDVAARTPNVNIFLFFWLQLIYIVLMLRDGDVSVWYFVGSAMVAALLMSRLGGIRLCRMSPS